MMVEAVPTTSQDMMMELLLTQLRHQDPLNPMDGVQFTQQLAQLQLLSETMELRSEVVAVGEVARLSVPLTLLGRNISGVDAVTGDVVTGVVDAVDWHGDQMSLRVGDRVVDLCDVVSVSAQ